MLLANDNRSFVISYNVCEGGDAGVGIAAWCFERLGLVSLADFLEIPEEVCAVARSEP